MWNKRKGHAAGVDEVIAEMKYSEKDEVFSGMIEEGISVACESTVGVQMTRTPLATSGNKVKSK